MVPRDAFSNIQYVIQELYWCSKVSSISCKITNEALQKLYVFSASLFVVSLSFSKTSNFPRFVHCRPKRISTMLPHICLLLCAVEVVTGLAVAQLPSLTRRSTGQGWSIQGTCTAGSNACSDGASCCPSGLFCVAHANDEVDACCTTSKLIATDLLFQELMMYPDSPCRGSIEGNPVCADSSWSLVSTIGRIACAMLIGYHSSGKASKAMGFAALWD